MVLLEVIVALTIFALVSLGLVVALSKSFDAAKDRNAADAAVRGVRNQFALLRGTTITPGVQDVPVDGSGMTYHIEIAPEPMQDQKKQPVIGMYRATITAQWKQGGDTEKRQISQVFYQP
jgi:type II secretory pathway pseudopilin PulG